MNGEKPDSPSLDRDTENMLRELHAANASNVANDPNQAQILEGLSFRNQRRDEILSAYQTGFLDAVQKILSNRQREAQKLGTWDYGITGAWNFLSEKHTPPSSPSRSPRTNSPPSPSKTTNSSEELVENFKAKLLHHLSFALEKDLFAGHDDALRKLEKVGVTLPKDYKPSSQAASSAGTSPQRSPRPTLRPRSASVPPPPRPVSPPAPPTDPTEAARKAAAAEAERRRKEEEAAQKARADAAERARQDAERRSAEAAAKRKAEEEAKAKEAAAAKSQRAQKPPAPSTPKPEPTSLPIAPSEDGEGLKYFVQACREQSYTIKEHKSDHAWAEINDTSGKGEIHYEEKDSEHPRLYTQGSLNNPFDNMALILVRMMLLQNKNTATVYLDDDVYENQFLPAFERAKAELTTAGLNTIDLEAENAPEGYRSALRAAL